MASLGLFSSGGFRGWGLSAGLSRVHDAKVDKWNQNNAR